METLHHWTPKFSSPLGLQMVVDHQGLLGRCLVYGHTVSLCLLPLHLSLGAQCPTVTWQQRTQSCPAPFPRRELWVPLSRPLSPPRGSGRPGALSSLCAPHLHTLSTAPELERGGDGTLSTDHFRERSAPVQETPPPMERSRARSLPPLNSWPALPPKSPPHSVTLSVD